MIANQSNIVSLRGYYRKKSLKASPPPDLSLACVSPYAARAGCGRQTCSYREGTRSSPRSSRGGTWCAPWGTSGACSPGRSRGRSAVGRRHLEFQVAGLRPGTGGERQAKRSARQWQLMGLLPGLVWEESLQSAARRGRRFQPAANRTSPVRAPAPAADPTWKWAPDLTPRVAGELRDAVLHHLPIRIPAPAHCATYAIDQILLRDGFPIIYQGIAEPRAGNPVFFCIKTRYFPNSHPEWQPSSPLK